MNSIKMRSRSCGDKELTPISVWSLVCHGQKEGFLMLHGKTFILKHSIINTLSTLPISLREVSRLDHETLHNSVKGCSLKLKFLN